MAAHRMASPDSTLPTRVSVLEHGVQELKTGLDGHRGETRASFSGLQSTLERISAEVAQRAHPTNWFGIISAAAAAVTIVACIFGLAEWRVNNAVAPIYSSQLSDRESLTRAHQTINDLIVKQSILAAEHERVKIEQDARIRARVEAEARAAAK